MASNTPEDMEEMRKKIMSDRPTWELVSAVAAGHEAWVMSALARGGCHDVTVPSSGGASWCLVTTAASKGHDHLLPLLLMTGLSIEGGGTSENTPLMEAALNGHTQAVKTLLDLEANPLATNCHGWMPLHHAAAKGHHQCAAALIPVTPCTPTHLETRTPVHIASYYGHVKVLEQLVDAGWSVTARDSGGLTPVHAAAIGGNVAVVQWLLKRGGDARMKTKKGFTPLNLAMQCGCHEVETWLAKNSDGVVRSIDHRVEEVRSVRNSLEDNHNTVVSWLEAGDMAVLASIPEHYDGHVLSQKGLTPLHEAALRGAPSDAVKFFMGRGVSPHVFTPDNLTPADLAQEKGHDSVIKGIQSHQCHQDSGTSPEDLYEKLLSTVSLGDDVQSVSKLLCKGAPIEPFGDRSILKLAVTNDRARIVSLLLARGVSLPANLLQEAWQSPDVTHRVLACLTTAYCCRLRAERRRLEKVSDAFVEGINNLVKTIDGNTPWQAAWRWGKDTDRPALSDLLAKAAAANCPLTAAFLQRAGAWPFFSTASSVSALHSTLEAGNLGLAELLIRDLGGCLYVPDTQGRFPLHMMVDKERQRLEQKLFKAEREKLENMELRLKADHEKKAARTALSVQEVLFVSHKGEGKNVSSSDGRSSLLLASSKGLLQLAHLLLHDACFPVDEVLDKTCGTTALHLAAAHGQDGCVALLLGAGANARQCDTYGHTPRHMAAMFGHKSTFELLAYHETQDLLCRAGTSAMQVRENFKIFHKMYYKYNRSLHSPFDHHDSVSIIRNLVKSLDLLELQGEAQRAAVDLSKGEALEVKETVMAEISIIMNKVSATDPTYRGELRLAGSSRDGSKLYAPDEFDINLVIHEDDVRVNVSKREVQEALLKGKLQISIQTDKAHLQENRFMANLYEEVSRCLTGHILQDKRLSLVPPGLTSTQVGVAFSLTWQGQHYPLLLVGVDLVPVLAVPWLEQVSRPFLTPKDTTTIQLSNAADGTWRCSFALTEAKVLENLSPTERLVQLMGKVLLSRLKAQPWMPRHKKRFFKWFVTREWSIAVPSGFCFKNAFLQWVEQRRMGKELETGQEGGHAQELVVGRERSHTKELGAGQEGQHTKQVGAGRSGDPAQQFRSGQDGDLAKCLVKVFRLMCANPDESPEHLATHNSSAYFGGECEGRKPGYGAPIIVQCLEEQLKKLDISTSATTSISRRGKK